MGDMKTRDSFGKYGVGVDEHGEATGILVWAGERARGGGKLNGADGEAAREAVGAVGGLGVGSHLRVPGREPGGVKRGQCLLR
jgi:hypothetical protein